MNFSVETAARMNPDLNIFFLFATTEQEVYLNSSKYLKILESYSNIHIRFFNIFDYASDTMLADFMRNGKWKESSFLLEHMSDILRQLTIYKYGGLYMDLDVLMLQPFKNLPTYNFLCMENDAGVASSIFHMDNKEGKKFTEKCLRLKFNARDFLKLFY